MHREIFVKGCLAVLVASSILLLSHSSVSADQKSREDDDDVRSFLDIAWVRHEHDRSDDGRRRVVHFVSMYKPWRSRLLRPRCSQEIQLFLGGPRHYVNVYWDAKLKAEMGHHHLATWRPDDRTVAVRVRAKLLGGRDRSYRWRGRTLGIKGARCKGKAGEQAFEDWAPDDRWIRHDLG